MKSKGFVLILFFLLTTKTFSQKSNSPFSILFYNVENLFDTKNNQETNDDEFTPGGERHWTTKRLDKKILNTSKVILSTTMWDAPTIIALCEIENREVLLQLISATPLKAYPYKIIHKESPDHRGIDVAFIYNSDLFNPIRYKFYPLENKNGLVINTREILYVSGVTNNSDTLHFFVNHWPSRYSGLLETKGDRKLAAVLLREKVDELSGSAVLPKIIIVGDFNDQPSDESISVFLGAKPVSGEVVDHSLYNLSYNWGAKNTGTLKYQSQWSVFDQIIVSGSLLNSTSGFVANTKDATIIRHSFLLEKDEKYGGQKPKRTFYGFSYLGGFSDHLPVLLQLKNKN